MKNLISSFFGTILLGVVPLFANGDPGFTPDQVIPYKQTVNSTGGAVTLNMDVFYPPGHEATDSRPAIVFFFGGGWNGGSTSQFHPHCEYLAYRGIVAISAEYRVRDRHGTTPQECVKDGKSAVRYLRENAAALGIDPDRIAAGGGSAGGHVAAAAGTLTAYEEPGENLAVSSKPNALVLYNPVIDNGPGGYGHSRVQAYWEGFSPMNNIDSTAPPTVFFLGTNDSLIPVATAETYRALMETAGRRCDLHLYEGQPHSFFNYDVPNDDSGPYYGYQDTVFKTDAFLVSLGYLSDPHDPPVPAANWVTIFGDAGFSGGSDATASPVTTDADADGIAANIAPQSLADGEFIRVSGSVTFNAPLTAGNFRVGLFEGDDPVISGDGTGYVGIWSEAPSTVSTKIAAGDGTGGSHPFETAAATILGPVPAAMDTVPANTPIRFSLLIARNGNQLDISTFFTDHGSYRQEQNLLNQAVANYSFNSIALLMTGNLNATEGSFSNIEITGGRMLPGATPEPLAPITYVDAVEGINTFATGGSLGDTGWMVNGSAGNDTQWTKRDDGGVDGTVFQALPASSNTIPSVPELTTTISGLADGSYVIWAFFHDNVGDTSTPFQNWVLSAGLTSGSLTTYWGSGQNTDHMSQPPSGATTAGVHNAADLPFTTAVITAENTGNNLRNLFGVNLGEVNVTGGSVNVYLDMNIAGNGAANRVWYDGVGYAPTSSQPPAPETGPMLLGIDFNRNDALGSPSQSLFRIISGSAASQAANAASYTKTIGPHQVTVSQPAAVNFEFRGANTDGSRAIPGGDTSLSFLVADFIATRQGAIDLEVTGLAAGDYFFRSRHLDTFTGSALGFAQGAGNTTPNTIEARIGGALQASVQPTALGSVGLNTTFINDSQIPTLGFAFSHDGTGPLKIELRSTQPNGSENFLLINGFELLQANP